MAVSIEAGLLGNGVDKVVNTALEASENFFFFFFYIPIKFYSKQTKVTRRCHEEHGNT